MRSGLRAGIAIFLSLLLGIGVTGCRGDRPAASTSDAQQTAATMLTETAPPPSVRLLQPALEAYQPQVTIQQPALGAVVSDSTVKVVLQVEDLPLFQGLDLDLGPHLMVGLDNQPARPIYSVEEAIAFEAVTPGTHTLRAFAVKPWDESFKNEGAFAQTTFSVLTPNRQNNPDPALPLITYNSPVGRYGAEPILLDFYLTNAPLKFVGEGQGAIADWRIRVTINDQSFVLDRWQPLYLKGFKPGTNWVKLEFLNAQGEPVDNVFNNVVQRIDYQPGQPDPLAALIQGQLSDRQLRALVDPQLPPAESTPEPQDESAPAPPATEIEDSDSERTEGEPQTEVMEDNELKSDAQAEEPAIAPASPSADLEKTDTEPTAADPAADPEPQTEGTEPEDAEPEDMDSADREDSAMDADPQPTAPAVTPTTPAPEPTLERPAVEDHSSEAEGDEALEEGAIATPAAEEHSLDQSRDSPMEETL
ncbi:MULTISPECIES: hypothetical protein [Spirulina]|uniref:hypothetical protein n=1 Tax=Spirulina TaxID=1154 RepID=UPI00232AE3E3|nr:MULTISPECIES: hypothetical protein [Spirulina]